MAAAARRPVARRPAGTVATSVVPSGSARDNARVSAPVPAASSSTRVGAMIAARLARSIAYGSNSSGTSSVS